MEFSGSPLVSFRCSGLITIKNVHCTVHIQPVSVRELPMLFSEVDGSNAENKIHSPPLCRF